MTIFFKIISDIMVKYSLRYFKLYYLVYLRQSVNLNTIIMVSFNLPLNHVFKLIKINFLISVFIRFIDNIFPIIDLMFVKSWVS